MTTWISHRGYTKNATENTAKAFEDAIALGFDHLETDLRTTRDGHIVLCHDPELSRISAQTTTVNQLTRKELEAIKLAKGEPLLFFDEFIERYSHLNWILDIKPDSAEQTIRQLEHWMRDPKAEALLTNRARFLMWHPDHEVQVQRTIDNAFCLARDKACVRAGLSALVGAAALGVKAEQVYAIPPKLGGLPLLGAGLVKRYHKQNAKVIGYLPETLVEHEQALKAGVDELLTNHAHLMRDMSTKR
ncbi:hypothetical protein CWE12_05195 [Aliidiomarina sedimenti]|uniref:GP-PDE domain-containing protein n=1 Tax=Aliidiomarina sedimenti TaxID=1933879 RepID=A0ABY0BZQ3_9GAMM|nr:glycerophosphodiester phosphodiesterase family protein [Aliidiomarina sedimenti]RUO30646.1 hypothetical protein CWE12_05195 [Aliidiomarina sedimenti]